MGLRFLSVGLFFLFILAYIVPLDIRPMVIPDEPRYGQIARETLVSGNWVSPRLNGLRYFEKPVLGYWAHAASFWAFGETAFAARLPSALAAGLAAALVFYLTSLALRDRFLAGLAAGVFLTFQMVFLVGTFCVLDSLFSLFVTAALVAFYRAAEPEGRAFRERLPALALFGCACGAAFLTKGFIAFAVVVLVVAPYLALRKRWKDLFWRLPWISFGAALAVIAPWAIAIHLREPDYWNYFIWVEHIQRFMGENAQHAKPFWYYGPALLGGAMPWTLFFPAVYWGLKKRLAGDGEASRLALFCCCWALLPFLFFSLSKGKLGTYILPCFPPLAILTAIGLRACFAEAKGLLAFNWAARLLAVATALAAVGLAAVQLTGFPQVIYGAGETAKWVGAVSVFAVAAALFWRASGAAAPEIKILWVLFAPAACMLFVPAAYPDRFAKEKAPTAFLETLKALTPPDMKVVSTLNFAQTTCWALRRDDLYILGEPGEFAYGLNYPEVKDRLLDFNEFKAFVAKWPGRVALAIPVEDYRDCERLLPPAREIRTDGAFVLCRY